jgi:anti-sigma factor RsiW
VTCRELVDFLLEYLSGTLSAAEQAAFEEHLADCPDCVAYLSTYQQTIQRSKAIAFQPDVPAPDDAPEELVHAILAARTKRPQAPSK